MKILDILNSSWMIDKGSLAQIGDVYTRHFAGPKIDFKSFSRHDENDRDHNFDIVGSTAIIPIDGPITPRLSFFSFFFGGTSFEVLTNSIHEVIELKKSGVIENAILKMNTPGGTVEGAFEFSKLIKDTRNILDISTFSNGMIASAGMLIAGATSKIIISSGTVEVGSIGVIARKVDTTKMNAEFGVKVHEFVSGKFKNSFSQNKELSKEDAEFIQSQVNFLFSMFATEISENREISIENIIEMQAKTFIGQQAIENGLVDEIGAIEQLIIMPGVVKNSNTVNIMADEVTKMSMDELIKNHPELVSQIQTKALSDSNTASVERDRIMSIQSAGFPGQEVLVTSLINDSNMTAGNAAIQLNQDMKAKTLAAGTVITESAPEPVVVVENATPGPEVKKKVEDMTHKEKFEASAELQKEFKEFPVYEAYLQATEKGNSRVIGQQ